MEKTGLLLDPYFSATKAKWIMDNIAGVREKVKNKKILLGTMDSWLIWKMTGGKINATDYTNASRTLLFNINTLEWDEELLGLFGISRDIIPQIKSSDDIFGQTYKGLFSGRAIPISGVIGDSQGALFGQNCFEPGMLKATYGTGSSVMMYTGDKLIKSKKGVASVLAWGIGGKVDYALEGIVICTGDTLNWFKDNLGLIEDFDGINDSAENLEHNEGVYLVPAFVGLGVPYWDMKAKAAIIGLSRKSNKDHFIRAALEAAAYQIKDAVDLMGSESKIKPLELYADGGLTRSRFMMQFQADMLGIPVIKTEILDLSLMGSAYLAGLAAGIWKDTGDIKKLRRSSQVFDPGMKNDIRDKYYQGWQEAVKKTLTTGIEDS